MGSTIQERERHVDLIRTHLTDTFAAQDDPDGEVERCGDKIAKYLNAKALMLVDVIDQFGDKLTSQDVQERAKAMDILHYMFTSLNPHILTTNDLTYLVEFLVDRLRDQHLVIPKVLLCLQPIVKYSNLPVGSCSKILNQIFMEINLQSQVHRIRRSYFIAIQHVLGTKHHLQDIQQNIPNFIEHFIDTFAGEKDPRNLVILFNIIPTVLKNFTIGPLEEELFESLACYFPIDFKPVIRANAAETITREDLASALHCCLSRTSLFSKFLVPLALEKLGSDLVNAKLDSLHLLTMCCDECYAPEDLHPFLKDIWHSLRREIFLEANEQVEASCISFIRSVFQVLSRDPEILKTSVGMIFSECKHHLSEPELRLSQPASKVLLAITESNVTSCSEVFGLVVSLLHQQFVENPISSNRKAILNILKKFIATLSAYPTLSLETKLLFESTSTPWDEIVGTWFTLLFHSDSEFVILALNLFLQLFDNKISHSQMVGQDATLGFSLNLAQRTALQEHIFTLISQIDVPHDLATCAILVMERLSFTYPDEVISLLAPKLLTIFTTSTFDLLDRKVDQSQGQNNSGEEIKLNAIILKAISETSVVPAVGRLTLTKLIDISTAEDGDRANDTWRTQVIACLVDTIDKIYKQKYNLNLTESIVELTCFIVESLNGIERLIKAGTFFAGKGDHKAYETFAEIVTKLMRIMSPEMQQTTIDRNWNHLQKDDGVDADLLKFMPVLLLEALLAPLYSSINLRNKTELINTLLEKFLQTSIMMPESDLSGQEPPLANDSEAYARLLAVLHNKLNDSEFENLLFHVESLLQKTLFQPENVKIESQRSQATTEPQESESNVNEDEMELEDENMAQGDLRGTSEDSSDSALSLLIWITRSLAMKGSSQLDKWIDQLISLLGTGNFGPRAAEGFSKILSDDHDSTLVPENHCVSKFLYKQRFFMLSVPKLITAYRQCSVPNAKHKMNYIKALSCQLKYVPKSVMHSQLENVIPLLIAGLSVGKLNGALSMSNADQLVVLSSLTAIFELFAVQQQQGASSTPDTSSGEQSSSSPSLVQYFRDLAPRLLELSSFKDNMEIRVVALKCLQRCAKFPPHIIVPLKNKIVIELSKCLDDVKRLVRKEAVVTRNMWILSGAPGGI